MWAAIWQFLVILFKYGPEIWDAIRSGVDSITLQIDLNKFDKAAEKAQKEKDQRDLENLFDPDRHP